MVFSRCHRSQPSSSAMKCKRLHVTNVSVKMLGGIMLGLLYCSCSGFAVAQLVDESAPIDSGAQSAAADLPAAVDDVPVEPADEEGANTAEAIQAVGGDALRDDGRLAFSFNGAPWREVLNWLAEESGLALHVSELPSGSFTYSDPERFSVEEAISRLNLFLIPQGYSVVRRGQLLSVITLGDPRSLQQLDAIAELVSREELSEKSSNSIVKCMIPLGDIISELAIAELKPLMLMSTPTVLPQSNQLIVVDTASKVRNVFSVIDAMQAQPEEETVVKRLKLKHTDFDTVVMVAGSHLGFQGNEAASADLSISTDLSGTSLFVSGTQQQVEKLQALLEVIDIPDDSQSDAENLILRSHAVTAGNLQAVYDVLVTILNDKAIRLSLESKTSSIVALAPAEVHQQIEQTIQELRAPAVEFAVVDLQTLDPYFAITLLGEMFGKADESNERDYRRRDDDENQPTIAPPRIDADAENGRLFVRGTKDQIAQVRQVVESLDAPKSRGEEVRVVPLRGADGRKVLELARDAWDGRSNVIVLPPLRPGGAEILERTLNGTPARGNRVAEGKRRPTDSKQLEEDAGRQNSDGLGEIEQQTDKPLPEDEIVTEVRSTKIQSPFPKSLDSRIAGSADASDQQTPTVSTVSTSVSESAEANGKEETTIRSQLTPEGILLQSEDTGALDDFESLLMQVGSVGKTRISPPVAYYLKYVSAEEAVRMLADLLDGENALASSPTGSLVNGGSVSSAGSGYYGSLLYSRDGRTTVSAGSATIVSDARLNRLIVQGTTDDIAVVEKYLKLIDKGESITNIETFGTSHVVELVHTKAEDVAKVIRDAYRGRIIGEDAGPSQQRGGPDPRGDDRRDDAPRDDNDQAQRSAVDKPTRGRQPEMTLAVHEASNSLVITAPDPLFAEVEKLIQSVDTKSEQVIQVIPAGDGVDLEAIMQRVMGVEVTSSSRGSSSRSSSSSRDRDRSRSSSDRDRSSRR